MQDKLIEEANSIARTTGYPTANFKTEKDVPAAILQAAREALAYRMTPIAIHDCGLMPDKYRMYGECITEIAQIETGDWYAHNNEYATQIFYCPFCGAHLI